MVGIWPFKKPHEYKWKYKINRIINFIIPSQMLTIEVESYKEEDQRLTKELINSIAFNFVPNATGTHNKSRMFLSSYSHQNSHNSSSLLSDRRPNNPHTNWRCFWCLRTSKWEKKHMKPIKVLNPFTPSWGVLMRIFAINTRIFSAMCYLHPYLKYMTS